MYITCLNNASHYDSDESGLFTAHSWLFLTNEASLSQTLGFSYMDMMKTKSDRYLDLSDRYLIRNIQLQFKSNILGWSYVSMGTNFPCLHLYDGTYLTVMMLYFIERTKRRYRTFPFLYSTHETRRKVKLPAVILWGDIWDSQWSSKTYELRPFTTNDLENTKIQSVNTVFM